MKIKITQLRFKDMPLSNGQGTWRKYECKTDKTGDNIIEMQLGKDKNDRVKAGDIVNGFIEDSFYIGQRGRVDIKILKAISAQYVYELLLKFAPGIENTVGGLSTIAPRAEDNGFQTKLPNEGTGEWTVEKTAQHSTSTSTSTTDQPMW